jgi:hypothetical protein
VSKVTDLDVMRPIYYVLLYLFLLYGIAVWGHGAKNIEMNVYMPQDELRCTVSLKENTFLTRKVYEPKNTNLVCLAHVRKNFIHKRRGRSTRVYPKVSGLSR